MHCLEGLCGPEGRAGMPGVWSWIVGRGVWSCCRGCRRDTRPVEFGCEWMQKCLLCVQGGWLEVCQVEGGLSQWKCVLWVPCGWV